MGSQGATVRPAGPRRAPGRAAMVLMTLLAVALALGPAAAQEKVEGNRYTNPRYGIEVHKPAGWYFLTAGTILDLAEKTAGVRPRVDPDPVKTAGFAVIISKVPRLGRDFDPQVVVLVQETDKAPADLVEACGQLRSGMIEPEMVRTPQRVLIDGKPAVRLDFLGYVDGAAVRASALCTFRDRRAYFAVAQALVSAFDGEVALFDSILQGFHVK